jgi:protein gp37
MAKTKIEWTDESSNPIKFRLIATGQAGYHCEKIAPGCAHCFAERINKRFGTKLPFSLQSAQKVEPFINQAEIDRLLSLRRPRKVFAFDMTDAFAPFIPEDMLFHCLAVFALQRHITFQVLTKRASLMKEIMNDSKTPEHIEEHVEQICAERGWCPPEFEWPLPNLWLGGSVSDQKTTDEIVPEVIQTNAAVRFVSAEPLLGQIRLDSIQPEDYDLDINAFWPFDSDNMGKIDWVIVGGESGPSARPMHPDWARSLRDQCQTAIVPFFFKQWGKWLPDDQIDRINPAHYPGFAKAYFGGLGVDGGWAPGTWTTTLGMCMYRMGKKKAGRLLDSCEHNDFPIKEV